MAAVSYDDPNYRPGTKGKGGGAPSAPSAMGGGMGGGGQGGGGGSGGGIPGQLELVRVVLMSARSRRRGKEAPHYQPIEGSPDGGIKATIAGTLITSSSANGRPDEKRLLSGSTNGKGIKLATTATPGDLIHTAIAGTTGMDFVRLFAINSDATNRKVTIEWGTGTAPDGNIEQTVRAEDGFFEITPDGGLPINNALVIRAFCATANVVMIYGHVLRINS